MKSQGHKFGLRTVAVLEASKGVAVLALCILLLSLLHKDLVDVVDRLTGFLRLNPDSRLADWCYDLADRTTGRGIWMAVSAGAVYATGRFLEAYGLWNQRRWGEWLSVITGTLFLPFELLAAIRHPHWANIVLLAGNVLLVFYIVGILSENRRCRQAGGQTAAGADACSAGDPPAARPAGTGSSVSPAGAADAGELHSRGKN